jgi:hypothetical protein
VQVKFCRKLPAGPASTRPVFRHAVGGQGRKTAELAVAFRSASEIAAAEASVPRKVRRSILFSLRIVVAAPLPLVKSVPYG